MTVVGSVDHEEIVGRVVEESGWTPRYAFMVMMSAGIAVLGLLLSSPAVVIGAMLISPLMNPILGLGFSLTLFDYAELRRSLIALGIGSAAAVLFTALIVLVSPLKAPTAEILSRTRPNLFDLAVALFAALAGTFAVIRGRGETIVGVAIATALMPPLAVVGYGLATWNVPVLAGSLALYVTNFVTIALSSMIMARFYGFGHNLSGHQGWVQTGVLLLVFVVMAVPLGFSLTRIAREAYTVSQVRAFLSDKFGPQAQVTRLDVDFEALPIAVRTVVIAPRARGLPAPDVRTALEKQLGRSVALQLDEVLLDPGASTLEAQKAELQATDTSEVDRKVAALVQLVAVAAGVATDQVTLDRGNQRIEARSVALPGATLATYRSLEDRVRESAGGWTVTIVPPLQALPVISFADNADTLDDAAKQAVALSAWAATRWNSPALGIPGLPDGTPPERPTLAQRRALAIAAVMKAAGTAVAPRPAAGQAFQLSPLTP